MGSSSASGRHLSSVWSRALSCGSPAVAVAPRRAFMASAYVAQALVKADLPASEREPLLLAQGAPGTLLSASVRKNALYEAKRFIDAAVSGNRADLMKVAFVQGHSGARAGYSDTLDA